MAKNILLGILLLVAGFGAGHYFSAHKNVDGEVSSKNSDNEFHNNNYGSNKHHGFSRRDGSKPEFNPNASNEPSTNAEVPKKAMDVLAYVLKNQTAPEGYVGGRHFKNLEQLLPNSNSGGNRINYQEWDVNPKQDGQNRGTERLITGDDGSAYYTNNHYQSFTKVK